MPRRKPLSKIASNPEAQAKGKQTVPSQPQEAKQSRDVSDCRNRKLIVRVSWMVFGHKSLLGGEVEATAGGGAQAPPREESPSFIGQGAG
jgi:hypothetical protein